MMVQILFSKVDTVLFSEFLYRYFVESIHQLLIILGCLLISNNIHYSWKKNSLPRRELNPGLLGESQVS